MAVWGVGVWRRGLLVIDLERRAVVHKPMYGVFTILLFPLFLTTIEKSMS